MVKYYWVFLSGNMDFPDDYLWSSYELPLESEPPVTYELLRPGHSSPPSQDDTLVFDDFSFLDMDKIGFLPSDELERELYALEEMSTSHNNAPSELMEIYRGKSDDFQELFGSDGFGSKIENSNNLLEENGCAKELRPHVIEEETQDLAKLLVGEVMDSIEPESLYSHEAIECEICFTKCTTLFELKEHRQACYSQMKATEETSVTNLEDEITVHFSDSATCKIPAIPPNGFSPENLTSSKTKLTLMYQEFGTTEKTPAEKVAGSLNDSNKLIPVLSKSINFSCKPIPKKARPQKSLKTVYECSICSVIYEQKQPLLCHMKKHATESRKQRPSALKPIKKHSFESIHAKTYPCMFCGRIFSLKNVQIEHQRIHNGEKPYTCNICLFSCSQSSNLARHKKSHSGLVRPFTCTTCYRKFATKQDLDAHSFREEQKIAKMSSQDETTAPSTNLLETVEKSNRQTEEKAIFKCSICSKDFPYKSFLKNHLQTHFKERPFQCTFCPKNYKLARHLKTHVASHGKNMHKQIQYLCMYCGKGFYKKSYLLGHEVTHLAEKPFLCEICAFSCSSSSNLMRHVKTHAGLSKPLACMSCNHKFATEDELNAHSSRHEMKAKAVSMRFVKSD